MKHSMLFAAAALLFLVLPVHAQNSGSSDFDSFGDSVLDTARGEYAGQGSTADTAADAAPSGAAQADEQEDLPYTPFLLSFIPGISMPEGLWNTSIATGVIGSFAGSIYGIQSSSVFNIADKVYGLQAAGVFNIAETVEGMQAAGVFNIAGTVEGMQLAGVFNVADRVNGLMFGWINIADSVDGATIGLFNFVQDGAHDLSVEYVPDSDTVYAVWRGGAKSLYTSMFAGSQASELANGRFTRTSFGLGIGTRTSIWFLDLDTELAVETLGSEANLETAWAVVNSSQEVETYPWEDSFLTFKAGLSLGSKGLRPVFGIKADIAVDGQLSVLDYQQCGLAGSEGMPVQLFDLALRVWPKWYMGIRLEM